jgi:hypothetical protein
VVEVENANAFASPTFTEDSESKTSLDCEFGNQTSVQVTLGRVFGFQELLEVRQKGAFGFQSFAEGDLDACLVSKEGENGPFLIRLETKRAIKSHFEVEH